MISVVIPTFNRAAYLLRTLQSVRAQTSPPAEIIVVDDGSTDNTCEAVSQQTDVRYVYQTNARVGAARNTGMRLATGDALLFLDSDDLLAPNALERLSETLNAHPEAVAAYSASAYIDAADTPVPAPPSHPCQDGKIWQPLIEGNFIRSPGSVLIRAAALKKAGEWSERLDVDGNEDWDMWLRLADIGDFVHLVEPLFLYRLHPSLSSNATKMHSAALRVLELQIARYAGDRARLRILARTYHPFLQSTCRRYFVTALTNLQVGAMKKALQNLRVIAELWQRDRHYRRLFAG